MIRLFLIKWIGKLPLWLILIVPFVCQIVGIVGLTGYLSFQNENETVVTLVNELRQEITARIQDHIANYVIKPAEITQIIADDLILDHFDLQKPSLEQLDAYFIQRIKAFPSIRYIMIGDIEGKFLGISAEATKIGEPKYIIEAADATTNHSFNSYNLNPKGERGKLLNSSPNYDPRRRPWYQAALQAGKPIWTDIYVSLSGTNEGLTLSTVQPLKDSQDKTLGVVGADLTLSTIGDFLQSLKIGKTGRTFIIERTGLLIASSNTEPPFQKGKDGKEDERLKATESSDSLVKAGATYLLKHFGNFNNISQNESLDFSLADQHLFLQILPFSDPFGLDWLIVVVIPEADFTAKIEENKQNTIIISFVALVIAIFFGFLTARWVTQPLIRLNHAVHLLAEGYWDQIIVDSERDDEVGQLTHSFVKIAQQLRESFIHLENKNAQQALDHAQIVESQQDLIRELNTPLIPLANGVLMMPLVGKIDPQRVQYAATNLLKGVEQYRATVVIVDLTGVSEMDEQTANLLAQSGQAIILLGAKVILTGMRPALAHTLVRLKVKLAGIVALDTLQSGIDYALRLKNEQKSL